MNVRTLRRLVAFVLSALLLIGIFVMSGIVVAAEHSSSGYEVGYRDSSVV